jgi:hypothetical protein
VKPVPPVPDAIVRIYFKECSIVPKDWRDYGLGDFTKYIVGRPHLVELTNTIAGQPAECPNCKMDQFADIEVVIQNMPLMPYEFCLGKYLSCPACPWASPMICIGLPETADLPEWFERRRKGGKP